MNLILTQLAERLSHYTALVETEGVAALQSEIAEELEKEGIHIWELSHLIETVAHAAEELAH